MESNSVGKEKHRTPVCPFSGQRLWPVIGPWVCGAVGRESLQWCCASFLWKKVNTRWTEFQWKAKSDLTSSYHGVANLHSQPHSLSHRRLNEEPGICTCKLQCPGLPGMVEVLLQTLQFQQSLFIAYLSGEGPLRSHILGWRGRWPQTPHHPHSGRAWLAPWAEGWSCRTHRRSRASHGPAAEVEQLDHEEHGMASHG